MKRGFTLIELLVVISIIGLLSSVVLASLNSARAKARDARRKSDLHQLVNALELYYSDNNSYPITGGATPPTSPSQGSSNTLDSGSQYIGSGQAYDWAHLNVLNPYLPTVPIDPLSTDAGPWCSGESTGYNHIYTYMSDGTHYILCAWMENTSDQNTLQYHDVPNPWNPAQMLHANYAYSLYNYVIAK